MRLRTSQSDYNKVRSNEIRDHISYVDNSFVADWSIDGMMSYRKNSFWIRILRKWTKFTAEVFHVTRSFGNFKEITFQKE